ncbi:hypothetical protein RHS01_11238 [Rhizoctonia solani]|uniref:DUF4939 domain-containing protein n=1 Tax=Rhizoctonia solani TaxID=456999 RepID=A0A8H7I2C0_9AGAM|nr:hypothetical protein RHS01_11238 [Rhizoctonia solani]
MATNSQPPSCSTSPTLQDLPGMEQEPTLSTLLQAIQALTNQVGSLQDQVKAQGEQIGQLVAICKETNDLVGDKDQGRTQAKPGPLAGPVTPPTHSGGGTHTPGTVRPGLKAPFCPSRGIGPKMELPDPYKGDTRGRKATQWLDCMLLWVALHWDQFDKEEQMVVWILYHMTDKAANWALPIIGTIIKGKENPPTVMYHTILHSQLTIHNNLHISDFLI